MTLSAGASLEPPRRGLARLLLGYRALAHRGLVWPPLVLALAIPLGTQLGDADQLKWTLWIAYGLLALSLDFVWGRAGIFSFGQTAMFGLGGYCYGVVAINYFATTSESWTALLAAVGIGAGFAALLGYFMFWSRLGDVYLAIITLAVTLVLYTVMTSTAGPEYHIGSAQLGGFNGMPAIPLLTLGLPGGEAGAPLTNYQLYVFAVAAAVLVYVGLKLLLHGRFGRVLAGIRDNELRMELLGYDVRRHKLAAFTIGGAVAGLGGGLFAAWGTFINPAVFTLAQAALVVIWVMVGGRGTLFGAFVGVIVIQWLTERADSIVQDQTPLILGVIMILVVLVLPGGIIPSLMRLARRARRRPRETATRPEAARRLPHEAPPPGAPEPLLQAAASTEGTAVVLAAEDLSRHFGGVHALDGVSLEFRGPGAYAVIGPNGAGKSTFFNVLIGRYPPSSGQVWIGGKAATRLQTFRRARLGLGIKLQVPSLFNELTVSENIWLAANASRDRGAAAKAEEVLRIVGLGDRQGVPAGELSHGEQQWLEIAMVLAAGPSTILLDEPTAGMTRDEKARTADLIGRLAREHTVVVVEHDMAFVRSLGVPVTMLHQGKIFRSGSFDEIHRDSAVIDIYLGRGGRAELA